MKKRILITLALLSAALHAQVPLKGSTVDATQGYTVNGAAPSNFMLCGNGTSAVFAASCGTTAQPFYQTIEGNGASLPQRFVMNFDANFTVSDTSPSTSVHLAPNITVNAATANFATTAASATTATNAGTATLLASTTQCTAPQVATGITVGGIAVCTTVSTGVTTGGNVSRSIGTQFQNTNTTTLYVSGWTTTNGGNTVSVACLIGASSASSTAWATVWGATVSGGQAGFSCPPIPPGWFYEITASGPGFTGLGGWWESH